MDAPSKLVGYFSRVFTKGFKYDYDDGINTTMKTMDETNFLISAGSSYESLKDDGKSISEKKAKPEKSGDAKL